MKSFKTYLEEGISTTMDDANSEMDYWFREAEKHPRLSKPYHAHVSIGYGKAAQIYRDAGNEERADDYEKISRFHAKWARDADSKS